MNFQNIPRSDKVVKTAFVPKLDAFMFFDYKQIEPRLLAYYLSTIGDRSLVDELNKGTDTYSAIIAPLYNKAPEDLTDEERQEGKTTYLSLSYGAGVWKLAKTLGVDMRTARDISDDFWR